jgi:molybdenum cofactor synthesis domain-containing protein
MKAEVMSVNISREKGTPKQSVPEIILDEKGVYGDAHAGNWHRQVSVLAREIIAEFEPELGRDIHPGEFAENITTQGLDLRKIACLDRLAIGGAELIVTQIGKKCHGDNCSIFREIGKCVMPKDGIFCKVLRGAAIRQGSAIVHHERPLKITVVTASDRASKGEYKDMSGPEIETIIKDFFAGKRWHAEIMRSIVPDDAGEITRELQAAEKAGGDVVIICGGTGIGPRDITPETVTAFCDKTIPGIMEYVRLKFGAEKPNALLSRSVAGIKGTMLVYAIPGSVKAAQEYTREILRTLEHAILMMHQIDSH